jgi:hypothetical protein
VRNPICETLFGQSPNLCKEVVHIIASVIFLALGHCLKATRVIRASTRKGSQVYGWEVEE